MARKKRKAMGLIFLALILVITAWTEPVRSQEKYPTRPIEIIIPFSAGGATDLSFRVFATYWSKKWGVPVNVINKPGVVPSREFWRSIRRHPMGIPFSGMLLQRVPYWGPL